LDKHFAGAQIVVIPDNDPQATVKKTGELRFHDDDRPVLPGQDHAKAVATRLMDIAKDVKHLELPGLPLKGDVVDWLDGGGNIDQLYDLVDVLGSYEPEPFQSSFHAVTWSGMDDPGPEHEWLVKNTLTRKELSMVAGESKAGKSFLVLDLALSVAQGIQWFGRRTMQGGVIYQAGEGATGIKKRIRAYREEYNLTTKDDLPFVLLPSRVDLYNSDDHTEALIDEINQWKKRFKVPLELIVIDTWATATPGANENDGKDVSIVLDRCAKINKATDAAVLLVHHMNSGGAKVRGHTSILANLENVLIVKQVEDHHDENNRQIREAVLDKNKDGEGGQSFRFVLKGVRIGTDEDGDAVTSCVVKMPDGAASDAQPVERPNVTNSEATLLRAIEKALDESGSAPPSNSGLPSGAESVIELKLVATAYDTLTFDSLGTENETDDERAKRMQNRRKVMSRCCESLMRKGIIGRSDPWIWLSGRRVKGYRPTGTEVPGGADGPPPAGPDDGQQPDGWWSADDFAN
jgi:GTPase SAR1 family protein